MREKALPLLVACVGAVSAWVAVALGGATYAGLILFSSLIGAVLLAVRRFRPMTLIALSLPTLYAAGCVASYGANSLRLSAFASQLLEHLPEGGEIVGSERRIEIFLGNGNHCDYFASVTIASDLSLEQLTAHYSAIEPVPAIPGEGVMPQYSLSRAGPGRYQIVLTDGPYGRNWDVRCT